MDALDGDGSFPKLDPTEKRLLEFIAIKEQDGRALLVGDVIYLNDIGSPATLHRRLKRLKDHDLVRYGEDVDGRKKFIELTPKAKDYCSKLGKCLMRAIEVPSAR